MNININGLLLKGFAGRKKMMKMFAAKVEEGRKGRDGQPSVGPVYRNLISELEFPPTDPKSSTAWDMFR